MGRINKEHSSDSSLENDRDYSSWRVQRDPKSLIGFHEEGSLIEWFFGSRIT